MLLGWLLAVSFLAILRPRWVAAVVVATLPYLLNRFPGPTLPWFHHGSVTAPILIAAALTVLADPPASSDRGAAPVRRLVPVGAAVAALAVASPLSPRAPGSVNAWRALGERHDTPDAIALVGGTEGVSAGVPLVPQLAHREDLHVLPLPFHAPDTLFPRGLAPDRPEDRDAVDIILVDGAEAAEVDPEPGFVVVDEVDGVVVLRRRDG